MSIIEEAKELFGTMRDATPEEQERIDNYLKNISTPTGVNIFNLIKDEDDRMSKEQIEIPEDVNDQVLAEIEKWFEEDE